MLKVFILGPYRPPKWARKIPVISHIYILKNVYRAWRLSRQVWDLGHIAICPHLNTAFMPEYDNRYLDGYQEVLKMCDCGLTVRGFSKSSGAMEEHKSLMYMNRKIFYSIKEFKTYLGTKE